MSKSEKPLRLHIARTLDGEYVQYVRADVADAMLEALEEIQHVASPTWISKRARAVIAKAKGETE